MHDVALSFCPHTVFVYKFYHRQLKICFEICHIHIVFGKKRNKGDIFWFNIDDDDDKTVMVLKAMQTSTLCYASIQRREQNWIWFLHMMFELVLIKGQAIMHPKLNR